LGKIEPVPRKYIPLQKYLRELPIRQEELTLTFEQIEAILKDQLPPSAYEHRSWWGNQRQGTHVESLGWMDAGWMVDTVDLRRKWVRFVRQ
jgi:hypothetical protein